jgi:hypothetical protein
LPVNWLNVPMIVNPWPSIDTVTVSVHDLGCTTDYRGRMACPK